MHYPNDRYFQEYSLIFGKQQDRSALLDKEQNDMRHICRLIENNYAAD